MNVPMQKTKNIGFFYRESNERLSSLEKQKMQPPERLTLSMTPSGHLPPQQLKFSTPRTHAGYVYW